MDKKSVIHERTFMKKRIDEPEPYIRDLPKCFILHSVNVGKYVQITAAEKRE